MREETEEEKKVYGYHNCISIAARDLLKRPGSLRFTKEVLVATPLHGKAGVETGRIIGEVFTLGLASISRATAGNANRNTIFRIFNR